MDLGRFESVALLPAAARYRAFLDDATTARGWSVAAAVSTLFIEGTKYERGELEADAEKRPEPALEEHPLVKHYGLDVQRLALTRAHRGVEGAHRSAAWHVMLEHVPAEDRDAVVPAMAEALERWLAYRDDVAAACGLVR
jgi:pyrroloquinoline-quinone synthase